MSCAVDPEEAGEVETAEIATGQLRFPKIRFPKKIRFPTRKEEDLVISARTTYRKEKNDKLRIVCSASHWLMDKGPSEASSCIEDNSTMKSSLPPMKFKLI